MSDTSITPNMNLVVPTVGEDPGPDWANNINADLGILDQHNHSAGQGVQITPSGLNINSDLPLNGNNLTLVNTTRFNNLLTSLAGTTPNLGVVYEAVNELYFNDGVGNVVQITKAGSVNATTSGISSGTATASFVGGTLVVDANVNTPANVQGASFLFGNNVSGSNYLTLEPPNAMASNYTVTLPPINTTGNTVFLTYDTSNNIGLGPSVTSGGILATGGIVMFGGTSAPTGYLLCNGSAVSRTTYASLFSVIATAYGIGDGSTTFNVPDFRGIFPRGVDNGAGNDPDTSSRTATNGGNAGDNVGSTQTSTFASHTHTIAVPANGTPGFTTTNWWNGDNSGPSLAVTSSTAGGSAETRPINTYVNFIIKT
jgi:microcystin-dependent protein